ncbi:EAL domain-containing protein [Halobacillus litoralis]|uniref:EAL domain-containing protein n=1 Tax=Halobacillus litoralis TaxID=45668 RepID=UPI001CD49D96|nr:EAL domain-containing protein [Halobacillus litoralis]MCA0969568.1 EAL domain-containing protein [Halobacillus litoralis]
MSVALESKGIREQAEREFRQWMNNEELFMHFQPIVHTTSKTVQGYEALTRFPKSSNISNPIELFQLADELNQLFQLEKHTRELAIESIADYLNPHQKLWVNVSPNVIHDQAYTPGFTHSVIKDTALSPQQIVFEITEQSAITDLTSFRELLNHYREQGFTVAIDDVGAGYSSLQTISEIKPDYLKVDRSLVTEIQRSSEKQYMLEALQQITLKMGSSLIVEGVETEEEFSQLLSMGVEMMQGYYFAKPSFPPPEVSSSLMMPSFSYSNDHRTPLIISKETTLSHLYAWLGEYTGPFDHQLAVIKTDKMRAALPLQEVVRFAGLSVHLNKQEPIWKRLLEWWRS